MIGEGEATRSRARILSPGSFERVVWLVTALVLTGWVAHRLGLFDWWTTITLSDGTSVRFPVTFATVDHPFHAARAETLRQSWAAGHLLRWVANHQGGYPAEFYPFGFSGFEVGIWGLLFGHEPMMIVHKLATGILFAAPLAGFALLARKDRLSWGVPVLALAGQLCIAGWWWSGGFTEIVEWGLVTNTAAFALLLAALPILDTAVEKRSKSAAGLAALIIAYASYTNTRSLVAVGAIALAVLGYSWWEEYQGDQDFRGPLIALFTSGVVALAIAMPQLGSLVRFQNLYYFVKFENYADLHAYWDSSLQAVSGPAFLLTIVGATAAFLGPYPMARVVTLTLGIYVLLTVAVIEFDLIDQLEPTRLMPFQRYLCLYLAAFGVFAIGKAVGQRWSSRPALVTAVLLLGATMAVPYLYVTDPPSFIPDMDRGLRPVATTADPSIADLQLAIEAADNAAESGTALLVLNTNVGWHDQLWAPLWTDRPLFYSDWLWYWQTEHFGEYDPATSHSYPQPESTLTSEYLTEHGIGAVVVTGNTTLAAQISPLLEQIRDGTWEVFTVREPVTIATFDGNNSQTTVSNEQINADAETATTDQFVRRNWFPRWNADGSGKEINHRPDGYMDINGTDASSTLKLDYQLDPLDWLFRICCITGLVAALGLIVAPKTRFLRSLR